MKFDPAQLDSDDDVWMNKGIPVGDRNDLWINKSFKSGISEPQSKPLLD